MRPYRCLYFAAASLAGAAALLFANAGPAGAHGTRSVGPTSGIPIPALSHGQMAVIADYRGEILALAARQVKTDPTFRRLLTFGNVQYSYCLWGLVPGSLRDEDSPFNECSHAYLSATQALLVHMRGMSGGRQSAAALISRIDADMVRNRASFVQCQFSGESFNTADVTFPIWRNVPSHTPSLIAFSTLAMAFAGGTILLTGGYRREENEPT